MALDPGVGASYERDAWKLGLERHSAPPNSGSWCLLKTYCEMAARNGARSGSGCEIRRVRLETWARAPFRAAQLRVVVLAVNILRNQVADRAAHQDIGVGRRGM